MIQDPLPSTGTCICIRKTPPGTENHTEKSVKNIIVKKKYCIYWQTASKQVKYGLFWRTGSQENGMCQIFDGIYSPEQKVITVEDTKEGAVSGDQSGKGLCRAESE